MTMAVRRLPGVRFDIAASDPGEILPRMDVAMFAGFAQAGPAGTPVAVSSLGEFERIFGGTFDLAVDARTGTPLRSLLHGAVAQFFGNGGIRCWVSRVLDEDSASRGVFRLPAAVRAERDGTWRFLPVSLRARHPGSWSDDVRLASSLERTAFRVVEWGTLPGGGLELELKTESVDDVAAGDLLRLDVGGGRQVLLPVESASGGSAGTGASIRLRTSEGLCVRRLDRSQDGNRDAARIGLLRPDTASGWTETQLAASPEWVSDTQTAWSFDLDPALVPAEGEACRLRWKGFGTGWGVVRHVRTSRRGAAKGRDRIRVEASGRELADTGWTSRIPQALAASAVHVERLRLRISTRGPFGSDAEAIVPMASPWNRLPADFPVSFDASPGGFLVPLDDAPQTFAPVGPVPDSAPRLERDGLSRFGPELFLDPSLCAETASSLMERAQDKILRSPEPLRGIHAFLASRDGGPSEEATLLAAPDSVHPRWHRIPGGADWWTIHPHVKSHPEVSGEFHPCRIDEVEHPRFLKQTPPALDGTIRLRWTVPVEGAEFELQESVESATSGFATIFQGASEIHVRHAAPGSTRWYRVRSVLDGDAGAWSQVAEVRSVRDGFEVPAREGIPSPAEYPVLADVHRALLRTAAARGDSLALLSLPLRVRWPEAPEFANAFRRTFHAQSAVAAWSAADERSLAHGMLSHPWIRTTRDASNPVPPEGALAGLFAATSLEGRAWVAPGNRPMAHSVALELPMEPAFLQSIQDAGICPIVAGATGFVPAWFDTLSEDPELRPANVRRFLGLLRRLAFRHGADSVFEPANRTLERSLERTFRSLLESLRLRGALRGRGEGTAYRVDIATEPDQGRVRVDLRVAPSLPLSFLQVTLRSSGERLVVEERK